MSDESSFTAGELESRGVLLVQDGNHGEYRPRQNEFVPSGVAFIRAADMSDGMIHFDVAEKISETALNRIRKGIGKPGDVLFSSKGTVGKIAQAPLDCPPFVCSPQTTFWRSLDKSVLRQDYLLYFLSSHLFTDQWESRKGETDMADYVSLTAQRELKVYVPSVDIQDSIVRVLSPIDERILLNRKMNRALETAVTVLFRSWFVDFDPVTAKVERRKPFGISDDVASLFPSEFEEDIPAGWRLSTIGQEVRVVGGSTPSTNEPRFWNGLHHWLTPKDLSKLDDPFVVTTVRSITDKGVARISSGILPLGTVLLSSRAPIGYTAIAAVPLSINQGLIAMKAEKELTTYFVYHWVRENIDEILSRAGGTTFAEISKTSFRPIPVVVPSRSVIEAFDSLVNPMFERILLNMRQSASLQKLRNAILPPLISGELCVKEADKQVEAASV